MMKFLSRFLTLLVLFCFITSIVYFLFVPNPTLNDWQALQQPSYEQLPYWTIILTIIVCTAFFVCCWMSIISFSKERHATKHIKKLADTAYTPQAHKQLSRAMKRALADAATLIETQKSALQRLTNEKVETNDSIVQEQLLAERQRLARELHDSVSQQLFAASMLLSALTEQADAAHEKQLQQVEKIVQQAQLEMRALLLHLRPVELRNKTLAEGLESLITELQEKAYFDVHYVIEAFPLSKAEEDHLFRIAQEALSNTLRHAKASLVEVRLIARDGIGILRIQDNGIGFDTQTTATSSYGLKNIAERAVEIGCTYKIVSIVGDGTIVEVKVPLQKEAQMND